MRQQRIDRDALLKRRDELAAAHSAAVALLEGGLADDRDGMRTIARRVEVERLYDELAAVQKRIDAVLARERAT
jgi:hypothetical protein